MVMAKKQRRATVGQIRLREWILSDGSRTQSALAKLLGLHPPVISQWLSGVTCPATEHRALLAEITAIDPDDWLTLSERNELAERRARVQRAAVGDDTAKTGTGR